MVVMTNNATIVTINAGGWENLLAAQRRNDERAARLLWSHLSELERQSLLSRGFIEVHGGDSGAIYRIHLQGPIVQLSAGVPTKVMCFVAGSLRGFGSTIIPDADTMLARKIALQQCETYAYRVANVWTDAASRYAAMSMNSEPHRTSIQREPIMDLFRQLARDAGLVPYGPNL